MARRIEEEKEVKNVRINSVVDFLRVFGEPNFPDGELNFEEWQEFNPERNTEMFDLQSHLQRQREFSEHTFGPGSRAMGIVDHIRKELTEIEADPGDLMEWIDVTILALDGAWRSGATPEQIIDALVSKQTKNEARTWPDWRTRNADEAIEHEKFANPHHGHEDEYGT